MIKKSIYTALFALTAVVAAPAYSDEAYPAEPITVIVPFPPGGSVDLTARAVTAAMSELMKQPFVVQNKAGAGGTIGHELAARAKPDGYTLIASANGSFTVAPRLQERKTFVASDFAAVGMMTVTPMVLVVPAKSPFKNFSEFLEFAKANPTQVRMGQPGTGSTNHIAMIQLQEASKAEFMFVPYKGAAPVLVDLVGGQIDAFIDQIPSSISYIKADRLRPLAVTTSFRSDDLPEVKTLAEHGLTGFDVHTTIGLLAPAGTPPAVISALNQSLNKALEDPKVLTRLRALGSKAQPMSAEQYHSYLMEQDAKAEDMVGRGVFRTAN